MDYETHYTERYMGLPEKNAAGYKASNVLTYCKDLSRPLMIIHGTADDNVYFMHSLKMSNELFRSGKEHEFLVLSEAQLGFAASSGNRLFLYTPNKDSLVDAQRVTNRLRGRSDEHDGHWLFPEAATPGAANQFDVQNDIVINEIMFHPPPPAAQSPIPLATKTTRPRTRPTEIRRLEPAAGLASEGLAGHRHSAGGCFVNGVGRC